MKKILLFLFALLLLGQVGMAQVLQTQGFEDGAMPPTGWSAVTSLTWWVNVTSSSTYGEAPTGVSPHTGSRMAIFRSYDWSASGSSESFASPAFTRALFSGSVPDSVSFWIYRDESNPDYEDEIKVYMNTTADTSGASLLGTVALDIDFSVPETESSDGWYRYAFPVPASYTGTTNYVVIQGVTQYGSNIYIDDISYYSYPPLCTGATAGTITGPTIACPSVSFSLGLTGDSLASGLSYIWKASTDGGTTFTAISGATNSTYNVVSQTVPTSYELVVTCSAGGSDSTPAFAIGETVCYCTTPSYISSNNPYYGANRFYVTGYSGSILNDSNISSSCVYSTGYLDRTTTLGDTLQMQQGGSYPAMVTYGNTSMEYETQVWVDANDDGTFADDEIITPVFGFSTSYLPTGSGVLNPPMTMTAGYHRMRMRCVWLSWASYSGTISDPMDPCASSDAEVSYLDGTAVDYTTDIIAAPPCTGMPTAGTIAGPSSSCLGIGYTLSLTGDSIASGLSIQWYADTAGGAFLPIAGATGVSYTSTTGASNLGFEVVVKCIASGDADTTPVFNYGPSPFYLCYCGPLSDGTVLNNSAYPTIHEFAIGGTPLDNITPTGLVYQQFWPTTTTTTATLSQGSSYTAVINATGDPYMAVMWIDYDRNGTFDDAEYTDITAGGSDDVVAGTSSAALFTVPVPATPGDTGLTGMRVRAIPYFYSYDLSSSDACSDIYDGATQDYVLNIVPGIPCTGTPTGGAAIASPASVCATTPFSLSDTGYTNGLGLEYQWYYRTTGTTGAYTAISGATSAYYSSPTGVTVATDYIFVVKCDSSSLYDTSSTVTITTNPFYLCYCGPLADGTILDNYADPTVHEFAIAGTTLDHVDATSLVYQRFWPTTPSTTATLNQGSTYTAQIASNDFVNFMAVMWIDYNQNGSFEDGTEYTDITAGYSDDAPYGTTAATASFLVPSVGYLTDTGYTGLRLWVIPYYYSYDMDGTEACTNIYDGSVEDYIISIAPGVPCTGTPSAGTAAAGVTTACPGTPIVLSDVGFTNGLGLEYQWYRADSGTTTYSAITGATTSYYSYTGETVSSNYIFVVKCDSSGLYDTSNIVSISQNPFYLCYCGPISTGFALDNYADPTIHEFTIAGTTLDHIDATSLVYQRFWPTTPSTTTTLNQGSTYTAQVTSNDYVNYMAVMWIDYDHSGTFDDGTEYTDITASSSDAAPYGTTPASATFYVPTTGYLADTGLTGLRLWVIPYYYSYDMGGSDACTNIYDGSVEDYVINIAPGIPCTGTPTGGTAMSAAVTVCPGSSFVLSDTGFTNGLGLEYHWYRDTTSAGTGVYTVIPGATSSYYSMTGQIVPTRYVFIVKCDSSGFSDTSNAVLVGENPYYLCYCGPATGTVIGSYGSYVPIQEVSISGTTLDYSTSSTAAYTELWPTTASTTTTLQQAVTYTVNVTAGGFDSYNAGMWIDYDHSASFDSPDALGLEEFTLVATSGAEDGTSSVIFTVPATADTGLTGLRIRVFPSFYSLGDGDACTNDYDECTQDYVITIVAGVACTGTPSAGVVIAPTGACPGATFTLSDTTLTTGYIGITYQWQSSPEGSGVWTNIVGATNPTYSSTTEDTATDYRMIVVCSGTGTPLADTSASILVVINPAMACVCTTPMWVFSDDPITDYSMSDFSLTGCSGAIADMDINDAADPITGYVDHTFDTVSLMQGGTYTASFDFTYSSMEFETQAWIDNGNDGIFDPTDTVSEVMGFSTSDASSATGTIFIPAAEIPGFHRMRVRNAWLEWSSYDGSDGSDPMDPCASGDAFVSYGTGDVVDYTVYIVPTVCDTVLTLTAGSITDTTATVSWNSGTAMNYEYTVNDTLASPTVAGTVTTDTSLALTGLTAGATYYMHVRTACGCGTLSAWETIMFHTGSCDTVVGLTASDISDTGAIITWTGTSTGYEYTIDNVPTAPTVAGIATTALSDTITTLSPGTTYYAHVRSSCFAGVYSAWVTIPITTGACDTVLGLLAGSSDSGAFFAWDAATGAAGYQYIINTSTSTPLASGTFTTDTSVFVDTLAPGVTYYAHVRVVCGGGNYSGWIEYPITELPCDMPTFVMYNITDSTASVTWSAASGSPAASFEYAIDNNPTPPTVGTVTTANADTAIGLTCNTLYYVHVRVHCGGGIVSPWFTDTFSTKPCPLSVQVVNGNPFDLQAYPNPAKDVVTVQVSGVLGNNRQVELTDVTGKVIAKVKMLTDKVDVSMNNLAAGIYLIRYSDDTHTQVIKVNKQ